MPNNNDTNASLSDQATFQGQAEPKIDDLETRSLGDQATFAGAGGDNDYLDDGMEIVDLAARYKIEKSLGKGGMGEVLLATDTRLNRKVAIKRILSESSRSSTAISRFLTEAKSIAALNHPNIVHIYDYGRSIEGPFLIMEYVEGGNLLDRCRNGAIPLEEAIHLACQLCEGLGRAHERGIIHRDIKPANILLTADGIPKLTDFGLAKAETTDTGMTVAGAVLGTLDFMPPEQRRDATQVDDRSDLWSLAATLYQMVTGESPKVIRIKKVPTALQDVLDKALEESKELRYQSASEMQQALERCRKTKSLVPPQSPADLGMGECPSCHTLNEPHRKFCRDCGDPLRCSCLKCEHEIPVWDKVCPECGGKQPDLIATRLQEIEEQLLSAELSRKEYQYQDALDIAQGVVAIEDRRLNQHRTWAIEFMASTQAEWDKQLAFANRQWEEAEILHASFNYGGAIDALNSIPKPLRENRVASFLQQLLRKQEQSQALLDTIQSRVKTQSFHDLLPLLGKAIALCGERTDLVTLRQELRDRETRCRDAYDLAQSLLAEGSAKQAFKAIETIDDFNLPPKQSHLRNHLENLVAKENEIAAMVKEMKVTGSFDQQSILSLCPKVTDYLELNPRHQKMIRLKDDLIIRMSTVPIIDLMMLPPSSLVHLPKDLKRQIPLVNSIGISFRYIPSGTFTMGEGSEAHPVTLTKSFYLGLYPVTQEQYKRVIGKNPSRFNEAKKPVETVSWEDAMEFCARLSALPEEIAARRVYRLPTEAEWEYACRAGSTSAYCFGDDESRLGEYAWFNGNSGDTTHPVGPLFNEPNAWGLYDMHGNVWEWCSDWYGDYPKGAVTDPVGPKEGSHRVNRGGCWYCTAADCRSAYRGSYTPTYRTYSSGFRLALSSPEIPE
jgi:formylglycine-generating enzyme required for sulfatase activity